MIGHIERIRSQARKEKAGLWTPICSAELKAHESHDGQAELLLVLRTARGLCQGPIKSNRRSQFLCDICVMTTRRPRRVSAIAARLERVALPLRSRATPDLLVDGAFIAERRARSENFANLTDNPVLGRKIRNCPEPTLAGSTPVCAQPPWMKRPSRKRLPRFGDCRGDQLEDRSARRDEATCSALSPSSRRSD